MVEHTERKPSSWQSDLMEEHTERKPSSWQSDLMVEHTKRKKTFIMAVRINGGAHRKRKPLICRKSLEMKLTLFRGDSQRLQVY
jgi:hypothetical protein